MRKIDLTGQRFGRLTVINEALPHYKPSGQKVIMWSCVCNCGNECVVSTGNLRQGITKSCGCYQSEQASKAKKKYNQFDISGEYGICYTNRNEQILFDLEDYDKIKNICWWIGGNGYVAGYVGKKSHHTKSIYLHRLVMACPDDLTVDHINHNLLDNRKSNLRIATYSQQEMNKDIRCDNPHGVKGIYLTESGKWDVQLGANGILHRTYVNTKEEAIALRKEWEEKYFGDFNYKEEK